MSEFHVKVVRIGAVEDHYGADRLQITKVYDYPVVTARGEFKPGDLAVYVPVDAVVPKGDPRWSFLGDSTRIRAKKLRGVFSMGLLTRADPAWPEGFDAREALGIVPYEPPRDLRAAGDNERDPGFLPVYTDIEGLRRYPGVLVEGEDVVLTEKVHGENARFAYHDNRLWVGSRTGIKREDPRVSWWSLARDYGLAELLRDRAPGVVIYGENYGGADLKYGVSGGRRLVLFDAFDIGNGRYLDYDDFIALAKRLDIAVAPELYRGPWRADLRSLSEGSTTFGAGHTREGFVVKPARERLDDAVGRVIFKLVGEGYHLRKGG